MDCSSSRKSSGKWMLWNGNRAQAAPVAICPQVETQQKQRHQKRVHPNGRHRHSQPHHLGAQTVLQGTPRHTDGKTDRQTALRGTLRQTHLPREQLHARQVVASRATHVAGRLPRHLVRASDRTLDQGSTAPHLAGRPVEAVERLVAEVHRHQQLDALRQAAGVARHEFQQQLERGAAACPGGRARAQWRLRCARPRPAPDRLDGRLRGRQRLREQVLCAEPVGLLTDPSMDIAFQHSPLCSPCHKHSLILFNLNPTNPEDTHANMFAALVSNTLWTVTLPRWRQTFFA
jgi:hypothetical protein